ncbi:MAG: hypothetical protein AAB438_03680 [Patescibacteria group bacterium]
MRSVTELPGWKTGFLLAAMDDQLIRSSDNHQKIFNLIVKNKKTSLDTICAKLNLSKATVRPILQGFIKSKLVFIEKSKYLVNKDRHNLLKEWRVWVGQEKK